MSASELELRRTPCIGICSTTYGDLICRGCKRFSHEIVGWNGYTKTQQSVIWKRLRKLQVEAIESIIQIEDPSLFSQARSQISEVLPNALVCLEFLRNKMTFEEVGIKVRSDLQRSTHQDLVRAIDQEFYLRSSAYYERSFKILST